MDNEQGYVWTSQVLRSALQYVNDRPNKIGKRNFKGVEKHLESQFRASGIAVPTSQDIQNKFNEISSEASLKTSWSTSDKHREFWRRGLKTFNLKHNVLNGVFSAKEMRKFNPSSSIDSSSSLSSVPETDDDYEEGTRVLRIPPVSESSRPKKRLRLLVAQAPGDVTDEDIGPVLEATSTTPSQSLLSLSSEGPETQSTGADNPDDTLHELAKRIEDAVSKQLKHVNFDPCAAVVLGNRKLTLDLIEIFQAVFGNKMQPGEVASLLADVATKQALSWNIFLRSLVAAGILKWAMLPEPIGIAWNVEDEYETSSNETLDALLKVLMNHTTKPQRTKLRHLVHKEMACKLLGEQTLNGEEHDNEVLEQGKYIREAQNDGQITERTRALMQSSAERNEIHDRATLLGCRLYLALAPLFTPEKAGKLHMPQNRDQYLQFVEDRYPKHEKSSRLLPPIRSFDIENSDQASQAFHTDIPQFQRDLTEFFRTALTFRVELIKSADALFEFDFPAYGTSYNQHVHVDDVLAAAGKANKPILQSDKDTPARKVYITTMFGVRALVRKRYTDEEYDDERLLTRALVHLVK